ncbi:MAG: cysteine--tRNA ligase [Patescibacteria group bacterium]|nr:cysteine--tRNA ligase [Patescibacteria group bacterium]
MDINIFNSLSREIEKFEPINNNSVSLYTCGPTVYNYPHIGNYRAYVFADMLKRFLQYRGYKIKHIMNITDVDDKTIRDSKINNKSLKDFTEFYTEEFFKDRDILNIIPPDKYTKATDYIDEMVSMIEQLLEKGYAYRGDDGSIYFDIRKDKEYGKLSHFKLTDLKTNADGRMKKDEYDKENTEDFALWKAWDENDGDVYWETSLGKGRPGWHIECSAMSIAELSEQIDIHTGGVDLIFPHHENEIAQSECSTGKQFVKYWMHNEHLMVDSKKMSKSLGNFYTLRDLIDKNINPLAFRLWLYTAGYRTKTNFTLESIKASEVALKRLNDAFLDLSEYIDGSIDKEYKNKLIAYMSNDLDTPGALSLLWDLVHDTNISKADKRATMLDFDNIFGFGFDKLKNDIIPQNINELVSERELARENKDWAKSDELRSRINELGYEVKDTDNGPKISKI